VVLLFATRTDAAPAFYSMLDVAGGNGWSEPRAVSGDGSAVVGYTGPGIYGYRWTKSTNMVVLNGTSELFAVSYDGSVAAGHGPLGGTLVRWTSATGAVTIPKLAGTDGFAYIRGLSADGNVNTGASSSTASVGQPVHYAEAFRWTPAGGTVPLGDLPGGVFASYGSAVSGDGATIVGSSMSADAEEPVRWTTADGGPIRLGEIAGGGPAGKALAVNANGSVIVGQATDDLGPVAFRWTSSGGMQSLGRVAPGTSEATGVSADGSVVIGNSSMYNQGFLSGPFIWDAAHGTRELSTVLTNDYGLDLTGWVLVTASGISADGNTIAGTAYNPLGQMYGWVAVVPEPASAAAALLPVAATLPARRRRRRC
jgi:uncharacterized membrane protein